MKKQAFTLAEILIVLTVIGIMTAILLPAARHVTPDEDLIKMKKNYNAMALAIRELVTSDKYYLDGDLGVKPDGSLVTDPTYFCKTLADVLNVKEENCDDTVGVVNYSSVSPYSTKALTNAPGMGVDDFGYTGDLMAMALAMSFEPGKDLDANKHYMFVMPDDTKVYELYINFPFGIKDDMGAREFLHVDSNGFLDKGKVIIMVSKNASGMEWYKTSVSMAVRTDGKIFPCFNAKKILSNSIMEKD